MTYDTRTGQLAVWRAGSYLGSWTDPTPLTSGSYISLRTDTADVSFDSLIVLSVVKYYYSGGQRIALRRDGSVFYLLTDQLGSTRVTTDESGVRAAEMKYYPFGWTRYNSGGDTPPLLQKTTYRFTGQRYGPGGGGLYDYGARWYDSYLNRWIQPDTIIPDPGNPQDLNRYAYCRNNPLKYIDPTGHQSLPPGVPNPYDWTAQRLLGAPDSRQLPQATGLQSLTTDIGKAVVEAIDKVNQVLAPAVEFLLGLFPGYDVVTAAVGTNVTGEKFSPGRRAVVGVLGLSPLDEVGDVASISVKFSNSTLRHEFARHAGAFRIVGNANKETLSQFESAIMKHITAAETKIVQGTFRGTQKVTHYYDPITRLWAAVGENGEFVAGWQLSEAQLRYLEKAGNIQ